MVIELGAETNNAAPLPEDPADQPDRHEDEEGCEEPHQSEGDPGRNESADDGEREEQHRHPGWMGKDERSVGQVPLEQSE